MPIGGASGIGWDENVPADTESMGLTDDRIRSVKTSVRQALDAEHNYPSAGGDNIGYHRLGSARPYFGTQSRVSSSGSDGRLMMTSDTSRLFGVGSGGTTFYGGSQVISVGTTADTAGGRYHWVDEFGSAYTSSNSMTVTFPNSGFSGVPYILVTPLQPDVVAQSLQPFPVVQAPTATDFIVAGFDQASGAFVSLRTFNWQSRGTRVF